MRTFIVALRPHGQIVLISSMLSANVKQVRGARKRLAQKVAADPVADHRDVADVRDAVQLAHLIRRQELRLVDQDARHVAGVGQVPREVDARRRRSATCAAARAAR